MELGHILPGTGRGGLVESNIGMVQAHPGERIRTEIMNGGLLWWGPAQKPRWDNTLDGIPMPQPGGAG